MRLSTDQLQTIFFSDDDAGVKVRAVAYGCPPNCKPDTAFGDESFITDRQKCNAEMMRRCKALCAARTRRDVDETPGSFIPFVMKSQARRNLQKILAFMPLDSDPFTFGTWLSWLESKSPFQNKFGETKTSLPDMIRSVAGQIGDDAQSMTDKRGAIAEGDLPSTRSIQA